MYDGNLEVFQPIPAAPGTMGGALLIRVTNRTVPVYLTTNTSQSSVYWDGRSCTTSRVICSSDTPCTVDESPVMCGSSSPCLVEENFVAQLPSVDEPCKLYLMPSTDSDYYSITFELPEARSNNKVTLTAVDGVVKGKFKFQPMAATSYVEGPVDVTFQDQSSMSLSDHGFDFTSSTHGIEFSRIHWEKCSWLSSTRTSSILAFHFQEKRSNLARM